MNNTPREPLLSDEEIIDETWVPDMSSWEPAGAYEAGMHWARRYYEDLITTGELRVVEDVELIDGLDRVTYIKTCPACNTRQPGKYPFCPGCGNKIKRTEQ